MLQRKATVVERLHIADYERYAKILQNEESMHQLLVSDARGNTALHEAAALGNVVLANDLLSLGLSVDARNKNLETPLIYAIKFSKLEGSTDEMVTLLLEAGANPLAEDNDKQRAVEYCLEREDLKSAQLLWDVGGAKGCQLLLFQMLFFDKDPNLFAKEYLQNSTVLHYRDKYGHNLLHYSAMVGHVELTRYFLACGCDVNGVSCKNKQTPLIYAAKSRRRKWKSAVIELLLQAGADITQTDACGYTSLHLCVKFTRGDTESVGLLIKSGIDVNCQQESSQMATPLLVASQKGNIEVMLQLIQLGADPSLYDSKGENPLNAAVKALYSFAPDNCLDTLTYYNILELLLTCGANPNQFTKDCMNNYFVSVFMRLLTVGNIRLVKLFLKHGANPRLLNDYGHSSLHFAARNPDSDILELLLNLLGADSAKEIQRKSETGFTALHIAAEEKHLDNVRLLCEYGADVNIATNTGETPLLYLLTLSPRKMLSLVEMLLWYGADPAAKTATGKTAIPLSFRFDTLELTQLIHRYALLNILKKTVRKHNGRSKFPFEKLKNQNISDARVHKRCYNYFIVCVEELIRMSSLMFFNNISYLDILVCNYNQLLKFVRNTELVSAFKEITELANLMKMPYFGSLVQQRFYQALTEMKTRNVARDVLKKLLPIPLCDLVVENILMYLNVVEVKKLTLDRMIFLEDYVFNPIVLNVREDNKLIAHCNY